MQVATQLLHFLHGKHLMITVDNGHSDTGYQIELNIRTAEVVMIIFKIHSQLSDRPTGSHYLIKETIIVINANQ